jgi:hypothetical protein
MGELHLFYNPHKDLVALTHPSFLVVDPRLVKMVNVLESFVQLYNSISHIVRIGVISSAEVGV